MKNFILLLCAFLSALSVPALPALAQQADQKTEAPRPFSFDLRFEFSSKTRKDPFKIGYKRVIAGQEPISFDLTLIGKKGAIESDTITFLDAKGKVLGTLVSTYDAGNYLKSQILTEGDLPPRALNWFETEAQSPALTLDGSPLTARYSARAGRLSERVLEYRLPDKTSEVRTSYDELGRRTRDKITYRQNMVTLEDTSTLDYSYDRSGLSRLLMASAPENSSMELTATRDDKGDIAQLLIKDGDVMVSRLNLTRNERGDFASSRAESFENGVLSHVFIVGEDKLVEETYKKGVISIRNTKGKKDGVQTVLVETFDSNGTLSQRIDINKDGETLAITTFNADGSVKDIRKLENDR